MFARAPGIPSALAVFPAGAAAERDGSLRDALLPGLLTTFQMHGAVAQFRWVPGRWALFQQPASGDDARHRIA